MDSALGHAIRGATVAFWALLLGALAIGHALAQDAKNLKGVALVIGQSAYETLPPLPNPEHDARAIEDLLAKLGFQTDLVTDAKEKKLQRAVEGFIEDAEGADVALIYYSGHGIEAGGINYLIPVDAEAKSLEAADEALIPLQTVLDQLRGKARITILLLDACRSSPFAKDARLRTTVTATGEPIAASGLGAPRGAAAIETNAAPDSIGEVLGFAAEPGKAALDGASGANSPYAAALLKHLAANQGYDFGQVMTMVTEEVYLATGTRQRPWTNASLRRFLSFGGTVEAATHDDALLVSERRKLLLTIAATPPDMRLAVESLAKDQSLPLDPLYGMLKELQVDTTAGPADLDRQLRIGADNLQKLLADKVVPLRKDPELGRLASLAGRAQAEGAIALAKGYRAKAALRADELDKTLDQREAELNADRIELASTYADYGATAILSFDYHLAAEQYGKAFAQVDGREAPLALKYKQNQANALVKYASAKGDFDVLRQSLTIFEQALRLAEKGENRDEWARTQNDLGVALRLIGETERSADSLNRAVAAFEAALGGIDRGRSLKDWAKTQSNLGNTLWSLALRSAGTELLDKAIAAQQAAVGGLDRGREPVDWAVAQNNLANTLNTLGERESGTQTVRKAAAAYESALSALTRERSPIQWAMCQNNLGIALRRIGEREHKADMIRKSLEAFAAALEVRTRDRFPLDWAATQGNLGKALSTLGEQERSPSLLAKAVDVYELALAERTRERGLLDWSRLQNNLGGTKLVLGLLTARKSLVSEGREAVKAAWEANQAMGLKDYDPYYRQRLQLFDEMLREMK